MSNNTATPVRSAEAIAKQYKKTSQAKEVWHRFKKNKAAVLGMIILLALIVMALGADFISSYDEVVVVINAAERLQGPSAAHWFGTDEFGRDIFARVVHGSRTSMTVGILSAAIALLLGGMVGAIAGYYGGKTDNILMRLMDVLLAIPSTILAIAIVSALGSNLVNLMVAIGISYLPQFARIVRASVLTLKDQEFVEAAKSIGAKDLHIIVKHIIPNCLAPVIVQATLNVAFAILAIAGLSFIGLGVKPPAPEWGAMLSSGRGFLRDAPWMTIFPGLAIMITILALNLLGDGLRDALDPRLKQ